MYDSKICDDMSCYMADGEMRYEGSQLSDVDRAHLGTTPAERIRSTHCASLEVDEGFSCQAPINDGHYISRGVSFPAIELPIDPGGEFWVALMVRANTSLT